MALGPPKDYKPEFKELGIEKVRTQLLMRRWAPDKLSAARLWIENEDAQRWLTGQGDAPPGDARKTFRKWAMMGLVLMCISPWLLYSVYSPQPFDMTAYSDSVTYEFRDTEYAHEFAELNEDAEWIEIE